MNSHITSLLLSGALITNAVNAHQFDDEDTIYDNQGGHLHLQCEESEVGKMCESHVVMIDGILYAPTNEPHGGTVLDPVPFDEKDSDDIDNNSNLQKDNARDDKIKKPSLGSIEPKVENEDSEIKFDIGRNANENRKLLIDPSAILYPCKQVHNILKGLPDPLCKGTIINIEGIYYGILGFIQGVPQLRTLGNIDQTLKIIDTESLNKNISPVFTIKSFKDAINFELDNFLEYTKS